MHDTEGFDGNDTTDSDDLDIIHSTRKYLGADEYIASMSLRILALRTANLTCRSC